MDLTLAQLVTLLLQNGASGILAVGVIFLVKHHLAVLADHKKALAELEKDKEELEKDFRKKIEELLKDQILTQKPLTEALMEYSNIVKALRSKNESTK